MSYAPTGKNEQTFAAGYYSSIYASTSKAWDDGYTKGYRDGEDSLIYADVTYTSNGTYTINSGVRTITVAVPIPDTPTPTPTVSWDTGSSISTNATGQSSAAVSNNNRKTLTSAPYSGTFTMGKITGKKSGSGDAGTVTARIKNVTKGTKIEYTLSGVTSSGKSYTPNTTLSFDEGDIIEIYITASASWGISASMQYSVSQ